MPKSSRKEAVQSVHSTTHTHMSTIHADTQYTRTPRAMCAHVPKSFKSSCQVCPQYMHNIHIRPYMQTHRHTPASRAMCAHVPSSTVRLWAKTWAPSMRC